MNPETVVSRAPAVNLYDISTQTSLVLSSPASHRDTLLGSKLMGSGGGTCSDGQGPCVLQQDWGWDLKHTLSLVSCVSACRIRTTL